MVWQRRFLALFTKVYEAASTAVMEMKNLQFSDSVKDR